MNPEPLPICLDKKSGGDFFDEIVIGRFTRISFHRTLRVPEDGQDYPLPAGLGRFPIHRVEDYADKVPANWLEEGGFFIPLYQKEALFLQLEGPVWHPTVAKVCVGKINAITGSSYTEHLSEINQDYVLIPYQRWLDGICSGEGLVKQFIAMPLGQGYTVEAQITDEEKFGGFQITIYDAMPGRFPDRDPEIDKRIRNRGGLNAADLTDDYELRMGIGAGGNIKQQIHKDHYGVNSWDVGRTRKFTIHLVNSLAYKSITGFDPPESPITTAEYTKAKIPWFSYYDEILPTIKPPSIFKRILGVSAIAKNRGLAHSEESNAQQLAIQRIKLIRTPDKLEASAIFRQRAYQSKKDGKWETALIEISYVIDLDADVRSTDFALRGFCNYYLGNYKDGSIDGTLGLKKDDKCHESLAWRALCLKMLGEYQMLSKDANELLKYPKTELLGLQLRAEVALFDERYEDALNDAIKLKENNPNDKRANQIVSEANIKLYGRKIPAEKITAIVEIAKNYIAEGVSTPEDFAAKLEKAFCGKYKPYTKALWGAFIIVDPETCDVAPDWHGIYSKHASVAATSHPETNPHASASISNSSKGQDFKQND